MDGATKYPYASVQANALADQCVAFSRSFLRLDRTWMAEMAIVHDVAEVVVEVAEVAEVSPLAQTVTTLVVLVRVPTITPPSGLSASSTQGI